MAREREKARESGREGTASSSWLTPLAWLLTRNICILCSQARDSERDSARLETELELRRKLMMLELEKEEALMRADLEQRRRRR